MCFFLYFFAVTKKPVLIISYTQERSDEVHEKIEM